MDQASPSADIKQLRRRARTLGLSIRTKRPSKSRPTPAYDVIETASGRLLSGGLSSLVDIQRHLESAVVDRRGSDARGEACPACGTPRLAFFRWCQSCGLDFETFKTQSVAADTRLSRPDLAPDRFCESCGKDERLAFGEGSFIRTPEGAYLCRRCAERRGATYERQAPVPATRPASELVGRLGTWAAIAVTIGLLAALAIQLSGADRAADGAVLNRRATGGLAAGRPPSAKPVSIPMSQTGLTGNA
jgi:hypothetical protein